MEKENVIKKIQKLLKLQYGAEQIGSTGEAFQAAKMVKKLLMEYNLAMSDFDTGDGQKPITISKSEELTATDKYGNNWKFNLLGVIACNNLCHAYKRMNGKMFIIGTEENTVIVKEFYEYLVKVFRRLASEHWKEKQKEIDEAAGYFVTNWNSIKNNYIRSYLEGVPSGLQENYDSLKTKSQETAMTVCYNQIIEQYVSENFKFSEKKVRARTRRIYGNAYELGQSDGRKVSLNRQIQNI